MIRGQDGPDVAAAALPKFYTVTEVAAMLRVSPMTIYRAVEAGEFPAVRVRTRIVVPAEALAKIALTAVENDSTVDVSEFVVQRRVQ